MEPVMTPGELAALLKTERRPCVIHFYADDAAALCEQVDGVLSTLAKRYDAPEMLLFLRVRAGSQTKHLCRSFEVRAAPTVLLVDENLNVVERVQGPDAPRITQYVERLAEDAAARLEKRISAIIASHRIMLFMKGTHPDDAKCKFSREIVSILREHGIAFGTYDILSDRSVREGLKKRAQWPTYPQLYCAGELIGGVDIVREMARNNTLREELGGSDVPSDEQARDALNARLEKLIRQERVMLFMKGDPETPQCGFSAKTVAILRAHQIAFGSFDILRDDDVRQGLKAYAMWPTYPQLYANGDLVGGLDIVQQLAETGALEKELAG
ncbi:Glutaredoxin-3 [Porphyridium purpureum]|uniref:Glutaredoxin-3 n=1 Tax=Porphyridium purpureum TaxID=35688 RepID=A0A5J4Z3L9_PORPP|nr:Glutaredoxin-3 [Porphyridium purpureum]|eukprot:POR6968..scf295_1